MLKRLICLFLINILVLLSIPVFAVEGSDVRFCDVPAGHWADEHVHDLRRLGITEGMGDNKFGMGQDIKRAEFVKFLVTLMGWELIEPEAGSFADNVDKSIWYYPYIETARKYNVITQSGGSFRPQEPITREEMAVMIVNTLNYGTLAGQLDYLDSGFNDVSDNTGYITIAKDFGIINGRGDNAFDPYGKAKREEAAAMMMRMYEKLKKPLNELHAFYAISSYSQIEKINDLDSVSFGWSRLEYDEESKQVIINITRANSNEYAVPTGFSEPFDIARQSSISTQLMVAVKNDMVARGESEAGIALTEYILSEPEVRKSVIDAIAKQVDSTAGEGITVSFDGVVIDFECMKGEPLKQLFNTFLTELKGELDKTAKKLYVAVHPQRKPGQEYYDAYDYRAIGGIADKVILMAHNYYATALTDTDMNSGYTDTPLTPVDEVYYALKAITDKNTGVSDLSKVLLQISFDSVLWKLKDGKVTNKYPGNPDYAAIYQRLASDAEMNYSDFSLNPYIKYFDSGSETNNILWYEDSRSVQEKLRLAKMFGINGISVWRLGNIPDYEEAAEKALYLDVWQQILKR